MANVLSVVYGDIAAKKIIWKLEESLILST
jgi:hypothetical protein